MIIKNKLEFGDDVYIKNDPEQRPYTFVGVTVRPGGCQIYELSFLGELIEMYDFETSLSRNELLLMGLDKKEED